MAEVNGELDNSQIEKLREGNISLIIEDYNDLFSDFDPRSYSERAISDDFLQECNRAARDKSEDGVELRILTPKAKRNLKEEWKIKKRLKEHFTNHFKKEEQKIRKIKAEGFLWFVLGTVFILALTALEDSAFTGFFIQIIKTILEPAGWFSFWEGLGKIFIVAKEKSTGFEFYRKMAKAEVNFIEY
ncbi:MAG: hypothetical protein WCI72_04840 [archaeon]